MRQVSFCLSALLVGSVVMAQDALDPVVVTANRDRDAAQRDKAEGWSTEQIERYQTRRINDLQGLLPGLASVSSDSAGFGDLLAVRGTGNTVFFGAPGVGMVVDDVPFADVFGYSTEFFDLDELTLHRGPQGSRFGRNGAGGLLEMRTAAPTDRTIYKLSAEYGSYDSLNLRFRTSGSLSERWSYGLQAYYKERDGFIDNTFLGGDTDTREQLGVLANLYYKPSDDLELRFRAMVERTRDGSARLSGLPGVASQFGPGIDFLRGNDPFRVSSNLRGETEVDRHQFSFHLTRDLGWATLKSISSYQTWEIGPNTVDLDLTNQPVTTSAILQEQDYWTQEFRLESDRDAAVRWTTGLFYSNKDTSGDADRFFVTSAFGTFESQITSFESEEDTVALYGNVAWDVSDRLTFDVGARLQYTENELSRGKSAFGIRMPGNAPGPLLGPPSFSGESDGWHFSPSLGLSYQINNETSLFARSSIGVKPQGFTAFSDNPATASFDEETSWENEIGIRYESADSRFNAELRGYYKRIDDYQLNVTVPMSTDFIVVNADRVTAMGLELEANWRPTNQLTFSATAGWSEIEFDDYTGPGGTDLSGNKVPFLPDFTASLGFRYDIGDGFYLQSAIRSVGTTYFDANNTASFKQDSYEVWDAQIGYETENWNAAIFGRNLFDEEYYTFINDGIAAGAPGDPGMVGVRVGIEF